MKSLIIYDNIACAANAEANLEFAAQLAGEATQGTVELCRLDVLKRSAFDSRMQKDTADAHLIVVALSTSDSVDAGLMDWLEKWATRREVCDAAIAVFESGYSRTLSQPCRRKLSHFARRQGLSFISSESKALANDAAPGPRNSSKRVLVRRRKSLTPFSQSVQGAFRQIMYVMNWNFHGKSSAEHG